MSTTTLNEREIKDYLQTHPDFLLRHLDVFDDILPEGRQLGTSVADLQQILVTRLRAQVDKLKTSRRDLINTGRTNEEYLARIHQAALRALDGKSISAVISICKNEWPAILGVDAAAIGLETDDLLSEDGVPGLKRLPKGTIDGWLGPADSMLRANHAASPLLFDEEPVRSQALLRLDLGSGYPAGVLAFGSHDPEWFTPDQATDLIEFLSGVTSRCLRLHLS